MIFVAGALVGAVLGFGAATIRARRTGELGVATILAAVALIVAAIALARSGGHDHVVVAPTPTTTTSTTQVAASSTTTSTTQVAPTVSVPNVVGQARQQAVTALVAAGLRVSIDTLALANVPPGFVISQNPLPAGIVARGTTILLVVSAAT